MSAHTVSSRTRKAISDKIKYIQQLENRRASGIPIPMPCLKEDGLWLALRCADWQHLPPALVEEQCTTVCGIFALDDGVALMAEECGIPLLLPEDVLTRGQIAEVLAQAAEHAKKWHAPLEKWLRVDGVLWPTIDQGCLRFFWEDFFLGQAVACAMNDTGRKLAVVVHEPYAPPLHYRTGDTFARAAAVRQGVTVLRLAGERSEPSALGVPLVSEPFSLFSLKDVEGATVVAALPSQLQTVAHALDGRADAQNPACFLSLGISQITALHGMPVLSLPAPRYSAEDIPFIAATQHLRALAHPGGPAAEALATQCLEAFLRFRWPWLLRWRQRLTTVFRTFSPSCLICTDVYDAENKLAAITAKELGIPVMTMGAGRLVPCGQLRPEHTDALWIDNVVSCQCALHTGFPAAAVIAAERCAAPAPPTDPWPLREGPEDCRVLVLLPLARTGGGAGMEAHMRDVQRWIDALIGLKTALDLRLFFAPHPAATSTFLQSQASIADEEKLPPHIAVDACLHGCDICIAVEEYGERFLAASTLRPALLAVQGTHFLRSSPYTACLQKYPGLCPDAAALGQALEGLAHSAVARQEAVAAQHKGFAGPLNNGLHWRDAARKLAKQHSEGGRS